jgi:hypothetical protein
MSTVERRRLNRELMKESHAEPLQDPCYPVAARTYTSLETFLHNLPYILMIALGAIVLFRSFSGSAWAGFTAAGYMVYGVLGAVWIMIFVCPFCRFWDTSSCPCGYGRIAAKIRGRESEDRFNEKFKRHVPVIVPLWFLPLIAAVPALLRGFSWDLVILVTAFVVDAFLILPRFSSQHGCRDCPQRQTCPWMKGKASA